MARGHAEVGVRRDPDEMRRRLRDARLMLIFTPEACGANDPLRALEDALEAVDVVQVRPKPAAQGSTSPAEARASFDWTARVLELTSERGIPVIVDDRVDVALALGPRGCAGVHLGQDDCPPHEARALLGDDALIGLSTHSVAQVVAAGEAPVDYLGFGPVHATRTKGYTRGLGAETCWVASAGTDRPLFPIGGIDRTNATDLAEVGRAAVCSAVLAAKDPRRAARELRELLGRAG